MAGTGERNRFAGMDAAIHASPTRRDASAMKTSLTGCWARRRINEDRYELMARLQQAGIAAAAVQNAADRCERDPQLKERGYFVPLEHAEIGAWPIENFPARFEHSAVEVGGPIGRAAPVMGQDNDYVYRGYPGTQ